jgi:hypothetical protein
VPGRRLVLVALATACLASSGCGGGSTTKSTVGAASWMVTFCGAVVDWRKELAVNAATFQSSLTEIHDAGKARDTIADGLGKIVASTDTLIEKVDGAGTPKVKDGPRIAAAVHDGLTKFRGFWADAEAKARKLPTDDIAAFRTQAAQLGRTINTAEQALVAAFEPLRKFNTPALERAAKKTPACQQLGAR